MEYKFINRKFRVAQHGFTLIELLVVIAILALLVSLVVPVVGRALSSAKVIQALSGIRQCGQFVLAEAAENNGRIRMHVWGSSSGMQDFRLEGIVSKHMGDLNKNDIQLSKIIRTPAWYKAPSGNLSTWHVWGLNYENDPDNGVYWEPTPLQGYNQKIHILDFSRVTAPSSFALLGDSSDINGAPHLRMSRNNSGGRSFALRYKKKGPIFTLDGSAKMIGVDQMESYSLRMGYLFKPDNPVTDPELITAY